MIRENQIITSGQEVKMAGNNLGSAELPEEKILLPYDRSIVGDNHNETLEDAWTTNEPREPIEVSQKLLTGKVDQYLPSGCNAADYEQELYEKDQYIRGLENEIRGLKASTPSTA